MYECVLSTCVFTSEFCLHFLFFNACWRVLRAGTAVGIWGKAVAKVYFKRGRNSTPGGGAASGTQMIFYR